MSGITDNIPEVFKLIADGLKIATEKIEYSLKEGMELFKSEIKTQQFSGRHGSVGLNTKTGKAKESLQVTTNKNGGKIEINLHSDLDYVRIHETITHKLDLSGAMQRKAPEFEKIVLKNLERI